MSTSPCLSLIVAMNAARVIGYENHLPWRLPADLKHFRQVTMGKAVIMGRKTYESIGKPLEGRVNIVLSRHVSKIAGCEVVPDLAHALALCAGQEESFIIGGSSIYSLSFSQVQRLYITWVDGEFQGDSYFPEFPLAEWQEVRSEAFAADERNPHAHRFTVWERLTAPLNIKNN